VNESPITLTESTRPRRSRKVLIPLTTLLAAGALTIGSGASFTSHTENAANQYQAGTLEQTNSKAGSAIFKVTNLKPGDTVNGTVTITNSGSLPASFSLTETATNGFVNPANLQLVVKDGSTVVYSGAFGGLGTKALGAGTWAANESHTYSFSVTLALSAGNAEQGKGATATYSWDSIQGAPVTVEATGAAQAAS
jgi:hypothetical protein